MTLSFNTTWKPTLLNVTLLAILVTLTACGGSGAADAALPAAPLGADMPANASAPLNTINLANAAAVSVAVAFDAESLAENTVTVELGDGAQVVSASGPASAGAGTVVIGPMNTSALADGNIAVRVQVSSAGATGAWVDFGSFSKDTVAPEAPLSVSLISAVPVSSGPSIINSASAVHCSVDVSFSEEHRDTYTAQLHFSDAVTSFPSDPFHPLAGGGRVLVENINVSALNDGEIGIVIQIADPAGNAATWPGTTGLKDTFVALPTGAFVAGSAANNASQINAANASTVTLEAKFGDDHLETDSFVTRFRSGVLVASSAPQTSSRGQGLYTCLPADCTTFPDGSVSYEMELADNHGNTALWSGNSILKDTVAGTALAATVPAGASNPADTINAASANAAFVDVVFDLAVATGDTVAITLTSGATTVTFNGVSNGTPTQSFGPFDASALADGSVSITVAVVDSFINSSFGFVGTCGKDTIAPAAPVNVIVSGGVSNDPSWINEFNVSNGVMMATTPAVGEPGRTLSVRATAGLQMVQGTFPAPLASSNVNFPGLNFSAFAEGSVGLETWCTDAAGNASPVTTGTATKDTIVAVPTAVAIAAGPGHVANGIALANAAAVAFDLSFGAGSLAGDLVNFTVTSGGSVTAPTFNAPAGAGNLTQSVNCSSLNDGSVALAGSVSDAAGNVETFGAFYFTKDTVAPAVPQMVGIPASAQNPVDVVNSFTAAAAQVSVAFGGASQPTETWSFSVSSGANIWNTTAQAVNPGSTMGYPIDMSTWADGSIAFSGSVTDSVGNSATFTGTTATKDTVGPAMPLSASVTAGATNAASVINSSSVTAVQVDVTLDAGSADGDSVTVSLTNATAVTSVAQTAPHGVGQLSFTGIDGSSLDDGSLDIRVTVRDSSMNETNFGGTPALKDTVAPAAPGSLQVSAGATNPADWINGTSASSTSVGANFGASYDGTETLSLTVTGVGGFVTPAIQNAPVGGGAVSWAGLDVSTFADGGVSLSVSVQDAQGNSATYPGTAATKDTVAPVAPQAVSIPATASSPLGVVNSANAASTSFDVQFTAGTENTDFFTLSMTDGVNTVSATEAACVQSGTVSVSINAAGNSEGNQTLSISLRDFAGNTASYAAGAAMKDTLAPDLPVNGQVMGGAGNPWHVINLNNVGAVTVTTALGANSVATDSVSLVLNGGATVNAGSLAATAGPGTLTFPGIDATTLADGPVAVQFSISDNHMNSVSFAGTLAAKDTVNADPISAAHVAAGVNNPIDAVNSFTVNAALVQVSFPNTYAGVESATITLDDGVNAPLTSGSVTIPAGGGLVNFAGLNTALLNEGNLTLLVDINDGSGNTSNHFGSGAVKDTIAPNAPTSSGISATAQSPLNTINAATSSNVGVLVSWNLSADPADRYVVTLSDGVTSLDSAIGIPVPNGSATMTLNSATLAEGPITVSVRMLDPVGNYTDAAGTAATRDVTAPAAPVSLTVAASANNASNWMNIASTSSVDVNASFAAGSLATDSVALVLTDSAMATVAPLAQNAPVGAGNLAWAALNCAALADGSIAVGVTITDAAMNSATYAGTAATKDTVLPVTPVSASFTASVQNPANYVNIASVANANCALTWPGTAAGDESHVITVGGSLNATAALAPAGGGMVNTNFDTSALSDGALSISVMVTDPAGNSASMNGTSATKDTVAPAAALGAAVNGSASNPVNVVNAASVGSASIAVSFGASASISETFVLSASDGSTSISSAPVNCVVSASTNVSLNTTALAEGALNFSTTVTDAAWNSTTASGTAALKDTIAPTAPVNFAISAGASNPANWMNILSSGAVNIGANFAAGSVATDTVVMSLVDDISGSIVMPGQAAPAGAGSLTWSAINCAALVDGGISLGMTITDAAMNSAIYAGTTGAKDTIAPDVPTSAGINASANNPANYVNIATAAACNVDLTWPGVMGGDETYTVTLGGSLTSSTATTPAGGGATATTFDASSLAEGAVSISVSVSDPAGNTASMNGTASTKDTVAPDAPTGAGIAATAQNPADWINTATAGGATATVSLGASSSAGDQVNVTLTQGAVSASGIAQPATGGVETLSFAALDTSAIADGSVAVSGTVTDAAWNTTSFSGTASTKDTVAPIAPASFNVAAGAGNAQNWINIASVGTVQVAVNWDASLAGTETASLSMTGGATVSSGNFTPPASGGAANYAFDASTLTDGNVTLAGTLTDVAWNTTNFAGTASVKDTVAPSAPTSAAINATANNPANYVNVATAAACSVDATWPGTMAGDETYSVTLAGSLTSGSATAPLGGGATATNFDASGLADGAVSISVTVSDPAGNTASLNGTASTKDTVAPIAPASFSVAAGAGNAQNWINIASVGTVQVAVNWDVSTAGTETASLSMTGGATVSSGNFAPPASGGAANYAFDASTLTDGNVTLAGTLTDVAWNATSFNGTASAKDTVAPTAPSSFRVASGAGNAQDWINIASVGTVQVAVNWDVSTAGTETASLSMTGGATVSSGNFTPPASGGAANYAFDASTLTDGNVTLAGSITDTAGNPTNFAGTASTKDTVAPAAATGASIATTAQNPANWINSNTQGGATATISLGAGSTAGDQVNVTLTQGAASISGIAQAATGGIESLNYAALDTSTFVDGSVALSATVTDAAGNATNMSGTSASRDTAAPAAPTFAGINATVLNPAGWVNNASKTMVEVGMTFGASAQAGDSVTLQISDGVNPAMSYGPSGATGSVVFVNQNMSALNDGVLAVTAVVSDLAGNSTSYPGSSSTKDTVAPTAPSSFRVAAGAGNAQDWINIASVGTVQVAVNWDASLAGTETASLSMTGGATVSSGSFTAPASGGAANYAFDASTLTDGNVTLAGTLTDSAWNATNFAGTAATKDTVAPAVPTSLAISAATPTNPVNVVNAAGAAAVTLQAGFGAFSGTDSVTATISDGTTTVTGGAQGGAATITWAALNCAALVDGSLSLGVSVTDSAGNSASLAGSASKDTVAPAAPSSINVPSGAGWNTGWFAIANSPTGLVRVVLPGSYVASDSVALSVTDTGAGSVTPAAQSAPAGGGNLDFSALNCAALADGTITLSVTATDSAMNSSSANAAVSKDTAAPVAPTSASVPVGGSNPVNIINSNTASAAIAELVYGATAHANDRAIVTFSDGSASAASAEVSVPGGGGTVQTAAFSAAALADGSVSVSIACSDLAGNTNSGTGTNATKDTVVPATPVVDPVVTPSNETTQEISGAADPSTTVVIDGGAAQVTTTSNVAGSWAVNVGLNVAGTATLSVTTTDAAGNSSAAVLTAWNSSALVIVQDAAAPDVPFTDISATNGALTSGGAAGGGFVDIDNDGDLDLFVGGAGKMLSNNGAGLFTDVTAATGALFSSDRAAVFGDYDNDGDMDVMLTHSTLGSTLWKNEFVGLGTLTFSDVNVSSGAAMGTMLRGAAWFDYNKDGWLDAIVADGDGLGNELIRNIGGSFTHIYGSGIEVAQGDSNWIAMGDFNGDGTDDVVMGDTTPGMLFTNNGLGAFTNTAGGASGFSTNMVSSAGGLITGDVDNDGDLDIFTCRGGAGSTNQLWLNNGLGVFTEVAVTAGISGQGSAFDAVFADFDNDGRQDLYLAGDGNDKLLRNNGDQVGADGIPEFSEIGSQVGSVVNDNGQGRMVGAGDIDADGDLDIYVGNNNGNHLLFRNTLGGVHCLKVRVIGKGGALSGSSKDAIGARIQVRESTSLTNRAWRTVGGGRGRGSQDPAVQYIGGLRPSWLYDVIVTFPSGISMTVNNVVPATLPGQLLTITEN